MKNNPLKYVDPTGEIEEEGIKMFNSASGEVGYGADIEEITKIINQKYGTKYLSSDILGLNKLLNSSELKAGTILVPNDNIPDITKELTYKMQKWAKEANHRGPWFFRNKVQENGEWDIKNQPGTFDITMHSGFVLFGSLIRKDAPGNISYGFVGKSTYWATDKLLYKKAGEAQINSGTSDSKWQNDVYYGDDPVDRYYIQYGIDLYNRHGINIYSKTNSRIVENLYSPIELEQALYN